MNKTGAPLLVREKRAEPLKVEEWQVDIEKKKFGPKFKKDGKTVEAAVEALSQELREKLSLDLQNTGKITIDVPGVGNGKVELDKELVNIEKRTRVENTREYTPNVIEPSFGIGRILYSIIEHNYWVRPGDEEGARGVSFTVCTPLLHASNDGRRSFRSRRWWHRPRCCWCRCRRTPTSRRWCSDSA